MSLVIFTVSASIGVAVKRIFEGKYLCRKTNVNLNCISNATTYKPVLHRGQPPAEQRSLRKQNKDNIKIICNEYLQYLP